MSAWAMSSATLPKNSMLPLFYCILSKFCQICNVFNGFKLHLDREYSSLAHVDRQKLAIKTMFCHFMVF